MSLGTRWSTVWLRRTGSSSEATHKYLWGVALFYAPEFGEGPSGLCVEGVTADGQRFELGEQLAMSAERKGWIVIRFPAVRVEALRLSILRDAPRRFRVSEARVLTAEGR